MAASYRGASLTFKNQKQFLSRPMCIHTGQLTGPKISCDSPFKWYAPDFAVGKSCPVWMLTSDKFFGPDSGLTLNVLSGTDLCAVIQLLASYSLQWSRFWPWWPLLTVGCCMMASAMAYILAEMANAVVCMLSWWPITKEEAPICTVHEMACWRGSLWNECMTIMQ